MHPPTPPEMEEDRQELPPEGMMFVGDKGKTLAGFPVDSPRLIPESRMRNVSAPPSPQRRQPGEAPPLSPGLQHWVKARRAAARNRR
jgi:hypothetical protein